MKPFIFFVTLSLFFSCESFVEIGPPRTESVTVTVYSDDIAALAAIRGIYHEMSRTGFASGSQSSFTVVSCFSSDEFISYSPTMDEFFNNAIAPTSLTNSNLWTTGYKYIYYCNSAIEGLQQSGTIASTTKNQLIGEAKFLRAFCHFSLMNFYGKVPQVLTTDYRVNAVLERSSKEQIFAQVIQDLNEAQALLSKDYSFAGSERVRATSWAATAMLARVYLYKRDWANAEQYATSVIGNSLFALGTDLNSVFLKNSNESIWQLMPVVASQNTSEGLAFVPASSTSLPPFGSISGNLISAFESGDKRKSSWIASQVVNGTTIYYPFKYKISKLNLSVTEYSMVLRLAEQYLIRAEARAQLGKLNEAMVDLDAIRTRAGLLSIRTKIPAATIDNLLTAIEQERRVELFTEWGHRWLDLQRWERSTAVLQSLKPGWNSDDVLYPVPQSDINSNPSLNPQNSGY